MQQAWGRQLARFPRRAVAAHDLGEANRHFLSEVGLPKSAAPFLSFGKVFSATSDSAVFLPTVRAAFDLEDEEFDAFITIGSGGADDPIAIVTTTHEVVILLDEEEETRLAYVNASVETLAKCLLVYRNFVERVTREDEMAYLEERFQLDDVVTLEGEIAAIDSAALEEGAMWCAEVSGLRELATALHK